MIGNETPSLRPARSKLRNILRGIVPTADATWGTAPTNLANVTDEDLTNFTGTGSKIIGGGGDIGSIRFDLGFVPTRPIIITGKIGIWSSAGTMAVYVDESEDGNAFTPSGVASMNKTQSIESPLGFSPIIIYTRYFRLRSYLNAAATGNARFYGVQGYSLE